MNKFLILSYKKAVQEYSNAFMPFYLHITPGDDTINCVTCICFVMRYLEVPHDATAVGSNLKSN